jgi:hypothetical protein
MAKSMTPEAKTRKHFDMVVRPPFFSLLLETGWGFVENIGCFPNHLSKKGTIRRDLRAELLSA